MKNKDVSQFKLIEVVDGKVYADIKNPRSVDEAAQALRLLNGKSRLPRKLKKKGANGLLRSVPTRFQDDLPF